MRNEDVHDSDTLPGGQPFHTQRLYLRTLGAACTLRALLQAKDLNRVSIRKATLQLLREGGEMPDDAECQGAFTFLLDRISALINSDSLSVAASHGKAAHKAVQGLIDRLFTLQEFARQEELAALGR